MRLLNIPAYKVFTYATLSFLFGNGVGAFDVIRPSFEALVFLAILLLFSLLCLVFRIEKIFHLGFAFFWLIVGCLYIAISGQSVKNIEVEKGEIAGTIISRVERSFKDQKFIFRTSQENINVSATLPSFPACDYGDSIQLTGNLKSAAGSPVENNLKTKKVASILVNPTNIICEKGQLGFAGRLRRALYDLSFSFEESLNKTISEPGASLAAGLTLGIKKNLSEEFKNALNSAGLTHIIALSGYNVTIIISVLTSLLAGYLTRRWIFGAGFLLVLFFIIMTGASSSVVRAGIFSFTLLYGKLAGRTGYMLNLMLLAALVMVLFNPFLLIFDIGFQLSFLAFTGLIYISEPLKTFLAKFKTPEFVNLTLSETLSAQLLVFPLVLYYFGRFSIVAPLSNLLVLWLVPWAMLFSFVVGLIGLFFIPLARLVAVLAWALLSSIALLATITAKIPYSSFEVPINNVWFLGFYGFIPLVIVWRKFKRKKL